VHTQVGMDSPMPASSTGRAEPPLDLAAALRLFDETTGALSAQVARLEQILLVKQAELAAAHARLGAVMDAVAAGVVAIAADGRVALCNPAACSAIPGLAPGADWRALAPDSPALRILAGFAGPLAVERSVGTGEGRRILACRASALHDQQGRLAGAVEAFDDITEVRRLAERAERVDRLKQLGEMAAGVAHEIRNPLNGIEGFASLLLRDLPPEDKRRRFAALIVEGVRDLNRTVSGLLEFTRQRRLERRPHLPADLVRAVCEVVAADHSAAGVAISVDDGWGASAPIPVDGPQIKQVLLNLVRNACEAAAEAHPGAGRVRIGIRPCDGGAEVLVDDDGPGVPAESRQLVFTPFHTTKDHGTGLGLAVSFAIVQLHGGSISVEDGPLGGARFRLWLPGS
jgi:signal transduction histidine kinase